jgi:glycosyltransferase involved in cell wall biosynthesis
MISFALEGITSFSIVPLRFVTFLGFITFLIALGLTVWFFIQTAKGAVLHGWSSTIISIYFFGAVQLISLGIIGEYTGKIYREVKRRPRYIIEKKII